MELNGLEFGQNRGSTIHSHNVDSEYLTNSTNEITSIYGVFL